MASNNSEEWRRKMVVKNIPADWSKDLLENFVEVVTRAELDNENQCVEYFCGLKHTVLLTFTEPLSDQHIQNAETETKHKGKPLRFSLIRSPPTAILVRDLCANITRDNLFYYFDSPRAGGGEGEVEDCQLYVENDVAVVTFSSHEVAARVLASEEHSPSRGTRVRVEPCYDLFHKQILIDLKQSQASHQNSQRKEHSPPKGSRGFDRNQQPGRTSHFSPREHSAPSKNLSVSSEPVNNASRDSQFQQSHSTSRQQNENRLPNPQQKGYSAWEEKSKEHSEPRESSHRGGRKKSRQRGRGRGRARHNSMEDSEAWGGEYRQNRRGRGRGYQGNKQQPLYPGRGRGQGLMYSQSCDTEYSSRYEAAYNEEHRVLSSMPKKQSSAPIPLVRLDADCEPIPYDAQESESTSDQFSSILETDGAEALSYCVNFDSKTEGVDGTALCEGDSGWQSSDFGWQEPEESADHGLPRDDDSSSPKDFHSVGSSPEPDVVPPQKPSQTQTRKKSWAQKEDSSSHTSNKAFLLAEMEERKRLEASRQEEQKRKEQEEEAERQKHKMLLEKEKQEREVERLERAKLEKEKQEAERKVQEALELAKKYEKQVEELRNRKKWTDKFPPYQLRLMHDFAANCPDIQIHETEGIVEFFGTEENYTNIKCGFLLTLQNLAEDSLSIPAVIGNILQTTAGQQYLSQISSSVCSFDVKDTVIVCAAHDMMDVQGFLCKLEEDISTSKVKVNKSLAAQLSGLKQQLENDYPLARLTLPGGSGGDKVVIEGLNGDADLATRAVQDFSSQNQPHRGVFRLTDPLEVKALKLWCADGLEQVRGLFWKSEETLADNQGQGGFVLPYQCDKDSAGIVKDMFDEIKRVTKVMVINLGSEFTSHAEKLLVVNGLHNHGPEAFCRLLEDKLKSRGQEAIISLNLPPKSSLPKLRYTKTRDHAARPVRSHPRQAGLLRSRGSQGHRHSNSIRPYSTKVWQSTLAVKSGDIASESVDALVCVVGEDMDLNQTAVGQAILKVYPQVAQMVPQQGSAGQVITLNIPPGPTGQPSVTTLFLTVLTKWTGQDLQATVKLMVQRCLQSAVGQGNKTVAFPPLGVGRKFQLPAEAVASAMVTVAHQFLHSNRGSLNGITFVIYDTSVARKFRETARNIVSPPPPPELQAMLGFHQQSIDSGSDDDNDPGNDGDSDDGVGFFDDDDGGDFRFGSDNDRVYSDDDANLPDILFDDTDQDQTYPMAYYGDRAVTQQLPSGFEARMCLQQSQHFQAVKATLCEELRSTFVFEDKVEDTKTFKKLKSNCVDEIKALAVRKDVALDMKRSGDREVLVAQGHKVNVMEVVGFIKDKIHAYHAHQAQKSDARDLHRHQLGSLPSEADRLKLPSYWTICQKGMFKSLEQWVRKKMNTGDLYPVSAGTNSEYNEILKLINSTWNQQYVGAGKDARNLSHRAIQVVKVERLENPSLWELYCHKRERMVRHMQSQGTAFTPVERVKGSTGVVRTTSNLAKGSLLTRDVISNVNEHYLFHGTKKEFIEKIVNEGLDSRIANDQAMLGTGIYASESSTKADQYTDPKTQRTSGNKTMILMRVLLGEPYINKNGNPPKYKRPPCQKCFQDRCSCRNNAFFDSVIDDAGRNFREFVVYSQDMCYPEYIITYQRV